MAQRVLVIGLGRFGRSLVTNLARRGVPVMAVDRSVEIVQAISSEVDAAVAADATDETALSELEPEAYTCSVVAIGEDSTESSILATALLHRLGAPRIVARAVSDLHGRVLEAVGAHEVINPEAEMGAALGRRLSTPNVLEQLDLGEGSAFAEVSVPPALVGKPRSVLKLHSYGLSLVAIRRLGRMLPAVADKEKLEAGDELVLLGSSDGLERLARALAS